MVNTTGKLKIKRVAKGKRAHVRRMKAEAQRGGTVYKAEITQ